MHIIYEQTIASVYWKQDQAMSKKYSWDSDYI